MKRMAVNRQPDLFEPDQPLMAPTRVKQERLAELVETLLREIAAALAAGEVGDDQDHG